MDVNLYPGGSFDSKILTNRFCNDTTDGCDAAKAGLYDPERSPTADFDSIGAEAGFSGWSSNQALNMTGSGRFTLDTMKVGSKSTAFPMPDTVFSSIIGINQQLPNGSLYPPRVGNLALGSPNPVQTFLGDNGTNVTGNLLTGYLKDSESIPSSSFGLHIGSVLLGHEGSLVLGGYDKSRVLGSVASFDTVGIGGEPIINMIDATIGVEIGGTPFNTTDIGSLYRADGNASVPMSLNPLVPYMFLPFGMCEAISEWLPVSYLPNLGLYAWNTKDYRYEAIINSPAYLSFTFQQSTTTNITIKVPFSLLNLTLDTPLVATPQPYFPCKPFQSQDNRWFLGRAFLQAAYLSINWEQNKFFLGQAPGPGSGPSSISTIAPSDATIESGPESAFRSTWQSKWTALPANASAAAPNGTADTSSTSSSSTSTDSLSLGAKIGIGVGAGAGGLFALFALVLLLCLRRKRKEHEVSELEPMAVAPKEVEATSSQRGDSLPKAPPIGTAHYRHEMEVPPGELDVPNRVHEASPYTLVHEAPGNVTAYEIGSSDVEYGRTRSSGRGWDAGRENMI